ncbi:helix-turn-helix transcriptional regulator [Sphingosinicella sp. CPCC 101087]|uniref:ArsR/SmtB family transcription factor n=1 Tax=Sphingosinicella sp. CPCC 101087 TaxID=2497754 RepID=UPI00101E004F|nr:metalloregulator ArsR/SmtB family transcription factor [Sphingosinicella sp. CPCC 101087]
MAAADRLSLVFSALGDPTRRSILSRLLNGPTTVRELAEPFDMSWPAVSQHLKVLERAGLIRRTARAQWRSVSIRAEPLDEASRWIDLHRREWNERFDLLEEQLARLKEEERDV